MVMRSLRILKHRGEGKVDRVRAPRTLPDRMALRIPRGRGDRGDRVGGGRGGRASREAAEESVPLVVESGVEEQGVGASRAVAVAEGEAPEPLCIRALLAAGEHQGMTLSVRELAEEGTSGRVEGADMAVAEIAHENVFAESAEVRRRLNDSPGGVQLGLDARAAKPGQQGPAQRVDIDEAVARAFNVIVLRGVLLGIADVDGIPNRMDTERSVASG